MQDQKTNGSPVPSEAIIPNQAPLTPQHEEGVEQKLQRAERSIAFRKGILKLIAANINPTDIVLFGKAGQENLHLTKTACKQILSWAGARFEMDSCIQEKKYDGPEGPYLDFEAWGTVITGDGRAVRVMGNRSTYDDFYAQRTRYVCPRKDCGAMVEYGKGCPEHGKVTAVKETYYLPITEVDIPAIKQAAITNLWNHAVEDLGFKPSLAELRAAGLDLKSVSTVSFGGDKNSAQKAPPANAGATQAAPAPAKTAPAPAATPKETATTTASGIPKAQIPPDQTPKPANTSADEPPLGSGIVSEAFLSTVRGSKPPKPYVKVIQNGFFLFCFHDSEVETSDGPKNQLKLIVECKGQYCEFVVQTKKRADGPIHYIEGARRIGPYEWDEEGNPKPMRKGWTATDEDIPF